MGQMGRQLSPYEEKVRRMAAQQEEETARAAAADAAPATTPTARTQPGATAAIPMVHVKIT